jgi:hypothetical protein
VSPSQSSAIDRASWTWPLVSPFTQIACRLRDQYVALPVLTVASRASRFAQATMRTVPSTS